MQAIETMGYEILFGQAAYEKLVQHLDEAGYSKVFISVDENTRSHCLPRFLRHTELYRCEIIQMRSGESNKNLSNCAQLWRQLTDLGADRNSVLLNLGGGVLTDLAGFAATTFKRGMDFIHIPTTLLNMVDASIGGKTGVNLGVLKNQIGLFSNPSMVLIDSAYLQTLPKRAYRSGFAEMIKYGLSMDKEVYRELQAYPEFSTEKQDRLIRHCAQLKAGIVAKDFREEGLRKVLNVGHTIGHAVEALFLERPEQERLLHGEAIAVGLIAEAYLSYESNYLKREELAQLKRFIRSIYTKVDFDKGDFERIKAYMKQDKKKVSSRLNFSLIKGIGACELDATAGAEAIDRALDYYLSQEDQPTQPQRLA